jgi:mannan endo-1,4-beta-mannosidase
MAALLLLFLMIAFQCLSATCTELRRWSNDTLGLITIKDGEFQTANGSSYRFYGTNAYWLQMLTDDDMDRVFHDIATAGFQVVRTWAFNDVSQQPASGTYFQV